MVLAVRISTTIPPGASVRLATSTRAPGWIAVTWSTTSDTTCSSSIAAPGSTVALGPVRTSTRIGSSVASTASSSSADSRAGAPGRGPASMPASSISVSASCRIRRAVSMSSGRPGGSGASGSARIRSTRRTLRSTRSRSRRSTSADTSASRGPSFKPRQGRARAHRDRSREWPCSGARRSPSHPRSRTCRRPPSVLSSGVRQAQPAPLGRRMSGRRPPVLVCKVPGSTRNPPSHRR